MLLRWAAFLFGLTYCGLGNAMEVRTGTYVGDGVSGRAITGIGFQPEFVLLKADDLVSPIGRTSTMVGDASKTLNGSSALETGLIQSLDADGFTVGSSGRVNPSGVPVYWVALKGPGLKVGSYAGDGQDNRAITGLGFDPAVVIVIADTTESSVFRMSSMTTELCPFFSTLRGINRIQQMLTDGFEVGTDPKVNALGVAYHYAAFEAAAGSTAVGSYVGDGVNGRQIDVGFQPEYVLARIDADSRGVHRPASLPGDATLFLTSDSSAPGVIQGLSAQGFQVGASPDINQAGSTYFWMAFKTGTSTSGGADGGTDGGTDGGVGTPKEMNLRVGCGCRSSSAMGGILFSALVTVLAPFTRRRAKV